MKKLKDIFNKLICKIKGHDISFHEDPHSNHLQCQRCGYEEKNVIWEIHD